ncbi:MAG: HEAT repeat domain-containing protein, partial [Nitrospirota bacterium]
ASSIEPLAGILAPKWWWFRRKEWSSQVRAAAAFALGQIPHAQAAQVLASFVNDRDPRVRQVARKSAKQ